MGDSFTACNDRCWRARKYHESLHFLFECHWYELTSADCPDRVEPGVNRSILDTCGSVAYFAPEAPDFQEAGELNGDARAKAVRILNRSGVPGGDPVQLE